MNALLLRGRVITPERDFQDASLLIENGLIAWVREGVVSVPGAHLVADGADLIAPGFIDLQVNGFAGHDAADGAASIAGIARALPATGVTGFLATLISRSPTIGAEFVRAAASTAGQGARVLGAHLEGPFLNPQQAGAHDRSRLLHPTPEAVAQILCLPPRMVTLAPELPGALDAIRRLCAEGVVVSAGHSAATVSEAAAGFAAGITFVTHLFNAMSGVAHRSPGLAVAALLDERVRAGLIADGEHVHPAVLELAIRAKGGGGIALTTDAVAAAGMPPGTSTLAGLEVVSDGRTVRRPDGTLAGAVAPMDHLLRTVVDLGVSVRDAIAMASSTPASVLGLTSGGRLEAGLPADLAVLDGGLRVKLTLIGGEVVYRAPN